MTVIDFEKYKQRKQDDSILPTLPSEQSPDPQKPGTRHERVVKAMQGLHEASVKQGVEVNRYRRSVSDLRSEIGRLEKSVVKYDAAIRGVRVKPLQRAAHSLEKRMDAYLKR
jgi:hypothetical protein